VRPFFSFLILADGKLKLLTLHGDNAVFIFCRGGNKDGLMLNGTANNSERYIITSIIIRIIRIIIIIIMSLFNG